MNKEDIVRLAQQAGFDHIAEADYWHPLFERFAALVAKAERDRLADQIDRMPFGDTAASFSIWIRSQA